MTRPLPLTLSMPPILANHAYNTPSPDHLALVTTSLDRRFNLHVSNPPQDSHPTGADGPSCLCTEPTDVHTRWRFATTS